MADYEAAVLTLLSKLSRGAHSHFLLVENMYVGLSVDALDAADSGYVVKLVDIRRIYQKCGLAGLLSEVADDLSAENRGMLHQSSGGAVLEDLVVYREDSAGRRDKAAGISREGVHAGDVDIVFFEKAQNSVYSVGLLLADSCEGLEDSGVMLNVCFKNLLCPVKYRELGGCGSGTQCKNTMCHFISPLIRFYAVMTRFRSVTVPQ